MRSVLWIDLLREIRGSRSRFLSIIFIVALGVAFFCGVKASEPDMHISADAWYDAQNFFDLRVIGTLGLTEEDRQAILAVEGVSDAEGMRSGELLAATADDEYVFAVMSLTERIAVPELVQGRLPETETQCLLDERMAETYSVGDEITFYGGDTDDLLKHDTFTVTGFARSPFYLTWERGTASLGNGQTSAFVLFPECAFATDYYTMILVSAQGALDETAFTDTYNRITSAVSEQVEDIADTRSLIRYESLRADGAKALADGRRELGEARRTLKEELSKAQEKLDEAAALIADGKAELEENEALYLSGLKEYEDSVQKLADGRREVEAGRAAARAAAAQLADAEAELAEGRAQLADGRAQLEAGRAEYEAGLAQYQTLNQYVSAAEARIVQLEEQLLRLGLDPSQNDDWNHLLQLLKQLRARLDETGAQLEAAAAEIEKNEQRLAKSEAELARGEQELTRGRAQLADSEAQLLRAEKEIENGERMLPAAKEQLADARRQLDDGYRELADAEAEYSEGLIRFREEKADAEAKISEAEAELTDAEKALQELKMPEWMVLDRGSIQTYVEYRMDSERIGAIGKVFPVIFFLVAALVSLTTMTRMVEEQRTQIGTYKALGYRTPAIAAKFVVYAFSATILGSLLGILVGGKLLPYVIQSAYGMLYVYVPHYALPIQWDISLLSMLLALLCTVIATFAACRHVLRSVPADLMRPAAPPVGKRILAERITPLWRRLSFSQKSTLRNLLRYKKRLFMTIFGIGGCMGLLMVGFGLKDSIAEIMNNQYRTIWTYDAGVTIDDQAGTAELSELLHQQDVVTQLLPILMVAKDIKTPAATVSAGLFVPEDMDEFPDFVDLHTMKKEPLALNEEGVIITGKLAKLLQVGIGDSIAIMEGLTGQTSVPIVAITENYVQHYVYLTPSYYEAVFGHAPAFNEILMQLSETGNAIENPLAKSLLQHEDIISYISTRERQQTVDEMMNALNLVIWVLIVAAGLLAFVVLYNLNNINITERRREMATLRVLGFTDTEMAMYIYRENIFLTFFGILLGMLIGYGLHQYVIQTLEVDMLMFGQRIQPASYGYSIVLTIVFSMLVNFAMYFRLQKIDMIESLKSVE